MIEGILKRIEAKPDIQILKLTKDDAETLYKWLEKYHYLTLPPFDNWIKTSGFLGRKIELIEQYGEAAN